MANLAHTSRDPTGEDLYNIESRSFLVIVSYADFYIDHGVSVSKFCSFELYRRHTSRPEIVTFDELLEPAWFLAEDGPTEYSSDTRDEANMSF